MGGINEIKPASEFQVTSGDDSDEVNQRRGINADYRLHQLAK